MAYFENTTPLVIPENDPDGAYSPLAVSTGEYLTGIDVSVTVTHQYHDEVSLYLICPGGAIVTLRENGDWANGTITYDYSLPQLIGSNPNGTWQLWAIDEWGDTGTVDQWSITTASENGLFSRMDDAVGDFVSPLVISGTLETTAACNADFTGSIPAVGSVASTVGAAMVSTGLAGIDLISTARPRELYRCYIESASQGEIEVPVSAITMRQNAGGTGYVQVSMPQYSLASALIARAADGRLRVDSVLEKEGVEQATPFAHTDALKVTQERGGRSRSITITGTFSLPADAVKTLPLEGVGYISDNGSTRRVRCSHNPRITVGDTVTAESLGQGVVQSTVLTIGQNGKQFELTV